jgi:hypothetical protein
MDTQCVGELLSIRKSDFEGAICEFVGKFDNQSIVLYFGHIERLLVQADERCASLTDQIVAKQL